METRKVLLATDRVYDNFYGDYSDVFFGIFDSEEAILGKFEAHGIQVKTCSDGRSWSWKSYCEDIDGDSYLIEHHLTYEEHEVQGENYYGV